MQTAVVGLARHGHNGLRIGWEMIRSMVSGIGAASESRPAQLWCGLGETAKRNAA